MYIYKVFIQFFTRLLTLYRSDGSQANGLKLVNLKDL